MDDRQLLERAILNLILKGKGGYGWYNIAIRLPPEVIHVADQQMVIIRDLESRGLIRRVPVDGHPHSVYEIESQGTEYLEYLENKLDDQS